MMYTKGTNKTPLQVEEMETIDSKEWKSLFIGTESFLL